MNSKRKKAWLFVSVFAVAIAVVAASASGHYRIVWFSTLPGGISEGGDFTLQSAVDTQSVEVLKGGTYTLEDGAVTPITPPVVPVQDWRRH